MKKAFLITLLGLLGPIAFAQSFTIKGFVKDSISGEALAGAHIWLQDNSIVAVSNSYGYFSIASPTKTNELCASLLGYKTLCTKASADSITFVFLSPASFALEGVDITADTYERSPVAPYKADMVLLKNLAMLGGEADIVKGLQLLPGVQQGQEGSTGMYVRGGTPDQNLILIDGVPIYNSSHLFGFLSVFNADAIRDLQLYTGHIPARYGERLSSVLDISLKEGNSRQHKGTFFLSPIAGTLQLEGPIRQGKSSYIVSFRKTWLDGILSVLQANTGLRTGFSFYDLTAKYNSKGRLGHFYWSFYRNQDVFYYTLKEGSASSSFRYFWHNTVSALRWSSPIGTKSFAYALLSYSDYTLTQQATYKNIGRPSDAVSRMAKAHTREITLRSGIDVFLATKHTLKFGLNLSGLLFTPSVNKLSEGAVEEKQSYNYPLFTQEALYAEHEWQAKSYLRMSVGVRQVLYFANKAVFASLQPRLSIDILLPNDWDLGLSYTSMAQFSHLLPNSVLGQPLDLWVPSTRQAPPQYAQQVSLGINRQWDKQWRLGLSLYAKQMDGIITYSNEAGTPFGLAKDWEKDVVFGTGKSAGVEFLIKKEGKKLEGMLSYTFARTFYRFASLNQSKQFPFTYDRPHNLNLVASLLMKKERRLTATFTIRSGSLLSMPNGYIQGQPPINTTGNAGTYSNQLNNHFLILPWYIGANNYRLPMYHRLDLSYLRPRKTKQGNMRTWVFSLYNAYNHLNPYFVYPNTKGQLRLFALFPAIPSVGYKYAW